jgi:hypothetical protein
VTTYKKLGDKLQWVGKEAAVAEFIRTRGITRCPTACVLPTQGSVAEADRLALAAYASARDRLRQAKAAARVRWLVGTDVPETAGE